MSSLKEVKLARLAQLYAERATANRNAQRATAAFINSEAGYSHWDCQSADMAVAEIEELISSIEKEVKDIEEDQRDHDLQIALIQRDTAIAQAEAAKLAAEATAKAQEKANGALDELITGMKQNG